MKKETAVSETLYQLTVRKGPKVGEKFLLETISLTVGRDPVSDIILNDPEVSRQHARFTQTDAGYQVQDLGSTNGTFVNGQRLESDPVDLQPGFTISMGSGVTLLYDVVPTGDALDATIVDQSSLDEMSGMDNLDEAMDAAVPDLPLFDDEPEVPADWEPDPSPPFTPPPPPSPGPAAPHLVATPEQDEADRQKRRNTIIAVTAVILLLCCCGFLAFMWFRGGDLLLEALGLI
ncbi:MAG: hypothetical protein CL608_25435 [Anaerolineaceae bacterium]|nr:hypothetical protein [Anaerolineaceae bacterium]